MIHSYPLDGYGQMTCDEKRTAGLPGGAAPGHHPGAVVLDIGAGIEMFALARNTYRTDLLDKRMRLQEFEALGRLAATIPLRQVTPSADLSHFFRLGEIVLEDFQAILPPGALPTRAGSR